MPCTSKFNTDLLLASLSAFLITTCHAAEPGHADTRRQLARPDGKSADQTKQVKVFLLMGQSNMVGMSRCWF